FSAYQVRLDHWQPLAVSFRTAFEKVHDRGSAAILLVHGAQGSGKTLFARRLEEDRRRASEGQSAPRSDNLWHALVGGDPPAAPTIEQATRSSAMRRVEPKEGWRAEERTFARQDKDHRARIFIIDDVHKGVFMREWAGLSPGEYVGLLERKTED